jgi:hypothetical protein
MAALVAAAGAAGAVGHAHAQPSEFLDVGTVTAQATPISVLDYVDAFDSAFALDGSETLTVKWFRFDLATAITGDLVLDIDTRIYDGGDLFLALYDSTGTLVAADDVDGSFPTNIAAGLSFGSSLFRTPPSTPRLAGQDGNLAAGVYWLALAAGSSEDVTLGSTNWGISTTQSYVLGIGEPGSQFIEMSMQAGNVTPVPPPVNDLCSNPLPVSENGPGDTPAWTGTSAGALNDGSSPCYFATPEPALQAKDIWFVYTPTVSGIIEVIASGGNGGGALPIITQYDSVGCLAVPIRCAGGGSIGSGPIRLTFTAQEGVPVQFAMAIRAGNTGPLRLDIRPLGTPCVLTVPPGAQAESEVSCGDVGNNGCDPFGGGFDQITPGVPVTGTLFNTRTFRDVDWFEFTVAETSWTTLRVGAQFASQAVVRRRGTDTSLCSGTSRIVATTTDYFNACEPAFGGAQLTAGTYRVALNHRFQDGADCGLGYEGYWLQVDTEPCVTPVLAPLPNTVGACIGQDAVLSASVTGLARPLYKWQVALGNSWFDLTDGLPPLGFTGSQSRVSGSRTPTLRISNFDTQATGSFRVVVTGCEVVNGPAVRLVADATTCVAVCPVCPADFDQDGGVTGADVEAFFLAFEAGEACGDTDLDGGVTGADVEAFFIAFEAGGC